MPTWTVGVQVEVWGVTWPDDFIVLSMPLNQT